MTVSVEAAVSTLQMTCHQSDLTAHQEALDSFEIIELEEGMENNFWTMSLSRPNFTNKPRRNQSVSSSVDSGLENEYTHVPTALSAAFPSMWVKIKYPIEVDDSSPNGMLSPSDFDSILQNLQLNYNTWQIFLESKRTTNYCRQALPRNLSTDPPRHSITVKVKFSAWVKNIDTKQIESAVHEVMNKSGEFFIEVRTEKIKK